MANDYIDNYKKKFYNHKIRGIYLTAGALNIAIFFVAFFATRAGGRGMSDLSYFILFGLMSSILLCAIAYANHVRLKKITDDIIGKRVPKINEEFWVGWINKSTVALVLWEVFHFILLYLLFDSNAPGAVIFLMFASMVGTLVIKLHFNYKVKEIRQHYVSFGLNKNEYTISWNKEMTLELVSAFVLEMLMIVCLIIEVAYWGELSELTAIVFVMFTIVLIVTLIVRLREKVSLRDEDELKDWMEKHKESEKKTATQATKQAPQATKQATQAEQQKEMFIAEEMAYEDCESFSALAKSFGEYAQQCGLRIDEGDCRNVISAMATSRAIWLRSEDEEFAAQVAKALSKYFTGKTWELYLQPGATTMKDTVQSHVQNGDGTITTLFEFLYKAKAATNSLNVLTIRDAEVENFETVFETFIEAFRAPEGENRLKIDYNGRYASYSCVQNSKIVLPVNLWYIFVGRAGNGIDKSKCEYATEIKLRYPGETDTDVTETKKPAFLSFARYNELLNDALNLYFLPLETWKKFDKIEEYLQEQIPFEITNPLARQMEKYSSIQLSFGEGQNVIIDAIIESRLIPLLEGYTKENVNQEGSTFAELLDGLFGMDNLPLTHKALLEKNLG